MLGFPHWTLPAESPAPTEPQLASCDLLRRVIIHAVAAANDKAAPPVGHHAKYAMCSQTHLSNDLIMELPYGNPLTISSVRSGAWPHAIKNAASNKSSTASQTNVSPAITATAMVIPSLVLLFKAIIFSSSPLIERV
jgi:hypothetical protein